ncbi:MAG: DUF4349 domain-containing protein [Bacteroidia bacterium]|nr:DUF4349 domain-containing protein [Bacteroidia bacterium]
MPRLKLIFLLLATTLSVACSSETSNKNYYSGGESSADYESAPATEEIMDQSKPIAVQVERKLIKTGNVEFQTPNMDSTRQKILTAVNQYHAYLASDQSWNSAGRVTNTIVARIPAADFDPFMAAATQGVEKFEHKEISTQDVTEEFLDVEARLKTKKELEARYLELLKKANTVHEILDIEKQIGDLRAEIESTEGRLKYLTNQVSFSTLSLTFYEKVPEKTGFGNKFSEGFKNGWEYLIWFFVLLTNVWPFLLITAILVVLYSVMKRRKKAKGTP